jgi:predicted polyphosphate/ATP-dependent NAD kinase
MIKKQKIEKERFHKAKKNNMEKIGLIVNPIAGMGGSVGLKGTDGETYKQALKLGAEPVTPKRTKELLSHIINRNKINLVVAPQKMGEGYVKDFDVTFKVIGRIGKETSAEDTKRIVGEMLNYGIKLLIFVGGDGTARDVYDVIDSGIPVVGVPAGVKVFSSVFAVSVRAAAEMVDAFIKGTNLTEEEVLDIDEKAFRRGRLASRLYGYLLVPNVKKLLQVGKEASSMDKSSVKNKEEIAKYIIENMDKEALYLLGPGTTLKAITDEINLSKTLLGVDAIFDNMLVGTDLNEKGILELFKIYKKKRIIVTPIGGNGFIFGRGSKQFTPEVIKKVGRENIIIVGNRDKVNKLNCLRVDTGDFELDKLLCGYMRVIMGYKEEMVMEVKC